MYDTSKENGFLVKPYKKDSIFARYLVLLANQPLERERIGHHARENITNKFNWYHTANALSELYGSEKPSRGSEISAEVCAEQMDEDESVTPK